MYGKEYLEWLEKREKNPAMRLRYDMQAHEHDGIVKPGAEPVIARLDDTLPHL